MRLEIANRKIGNGEKVFIVAELSGNHNHKFDIAVKSLEAMKKTGADAVKIQTYTANTLTIDSNKKYFRINQGGGLWDGKTLYKLYQEAYTPWEWQPKLQKVAKKLGLIFFSTPFDFTAVDFLEKMRVPAFKVASFEANDLPLIEYIAKKGKPVIISVGMSSLAEIEAAVNTCKKVNNRQIIILKCTSQYPAPYSEANLVTIPDMISRFKTVVGLSDHTPGIVAPVVATALGAKVVEKHFILDRKLGGPDAEFSLEPREFKKMVESIRAAELTLGKINYSLSKKTLKSKIFRRSLFAVKDIKKGELLTEINVRSIRPGYGLPSKFIRKVLGKQATKNIQKGTPLSWDLL